MSFQQMVVFRYLNAIQTMCPHILRYLTTAVITNRRRRQAHHHQLLKDLVKVIQQVGGHCALVASLSDLSLNSVHYINTCLCC